MSAEFRLLGGLEAFADGRPLRLGHARQKAVLAVLLTEANRLVTTDKLEYRVWGGEPPSGARQSLHSYLSRLRRALAGAAAIERRPGGYLLSVDAAAIDLHRFRELTARAGRAEDSAEALRLLDRALGLWRGEALDGLDTAWLNDLRAALAAERFTAALAHNDLRLAHGRHAELPGDLAADLAEHPTDERLAGQYLLALYRNGRQGEALEHFERLRRRLRAELGADPGPELRLLHRRILTADAALDPPQRPGSAARPAVPVPRQLPPLPAGFAGRETELSDMDDLAAGGGVVVVSGAGGMGKSWLALTWAHEAAQRFPDGQIYVNLRGFDPAAPPMEPATALRGVLDGLGVPPASIPADLHAQVGRYRSLVADKKLLVLLDDARDAEQVASLLPGSPGCVCLITSRRDLSALTAATGAGPLRLGTLDDTESFGALNARLPLARLDAEPGPVAELIEHCAGLPLALGILAARAAARPDIPLSNLAAELRDARSRLDLLDTGELSAGLRAVHHSTVAALEPHGAKLFAFLGVAELTRFSVDAAASLAGTDRAEARRALRELERAHLVQELPSGRFRMHDLTRLYAAEHAATRLAEEIRLPALRRLVGHHMHSAIAGAWSISPERADHEFAAPEPGTLVTESTGYDPAMEWFAHEHDNLLSCQHIAVDNGWDELAWPFAWTLIPFHHRKCLDDEEITAWRSALGSAHRIDDPVLTAMASLQLGQALAHAGRYDEADRRLEQAVALAAACDDPYQLAGAHASFSMSLEWRQRYDQALEHSEAAYRAIRRTGNRAKQIDLRNTLGWLYAHCGDFDRARELCAAALAEALELPRLNVVSNIRDSLGYIAFHTGRYDEAFEHYGRALERFRRDGMHEEEPRVLERIAEVNEALGWTKIARKLRGEAMDLYRDYGFIEHAERLRAELG